MNARPLTFHNMRAMGINRNQSTRAVRQLKLPALIGAAILSLALATALSGCVNVASYTQPTLVRVIDASYSAPAINVYVESNLLAGNIGQGTITPYGALASSTAASIKMTAATSTTALITTSSLLLAGHQHSVLISDNSAAPNLYNVAVLEDQQTAAAGGHSAFRVLNQASKAGAVDVYMVPAGTPLLSANPIITSLPAGVASSYISFTSQTVTMVVTPTGHATAGYTSTPFALTGGEVRTVLLVDNQLTANPPIQAYIANDVN